MQGSSPVTAAGPRGNFTRFPSSNSLIFVTNVGEGWNDCQLKEHGDPLRQGVHSFQRGLRTIKAKPGWCLDILRMACQFTISILWELQEQEFGS